MFPLAPSAEPFFLDPFPMEKSRASPGIPSVMIDSHLAKSSTRQILISEPDEEQLKKHLEGRDVSPKLSRFLTSLIKRHKWPRKINIPSAHDNLAAVLVFTSELKEAGLEIFSELHVFFADAVIVEKWRVMGETDRTSSMPKEAFTSLEIEKVRLVNQKVTVTLTMTLPAGGTKSIVRVFDFTANEPNIRVVPHPFF
jgi:hypothetical protein